MGVDEFFRLRARLVDLARGVDADPRALAYCPQVKRARLPRCLAASIYATAAITRSTFWTGLAPNGKRQCAIFTPAVGGDDRARPKKIE
jgi:hypothetical protein